MTMHAVVLAKAADIIRREFRTEDSWSLDQIDCQEECIPKIILRFIQMVLSGTNIQTDADNSSTKQADFAISQLIMCKGPFIYKVTGGWGIYGGSPEK